MKRRDIDQYFNETKIQLEVKLSKASELLSSIEQKLNEVETGRQQSATTLTTLNENYSSAISLINQTRTDLEKVTELRTLAFDPNSGIEPLLAKINQISQQAEELVAKIEAFTTEAQGQKEKIGEDKKVSSEKLAEIEKLNDKAKSLLANIEKTYQLAINTGLAGSFDKRRKEIHDGFVSHWGKRLTISIVLLAISAAFILFVTFALVEFKLGQFNLEPLLIFRIALLSPLVFYTGYAAVQYGKERALLEKYAFKATVAASLESYITILTSNFAEKEHKDEILKFVIKSMSLIYSEPHEEIKKRKFGFTFGNKLAEMKSEIAEEVAEKIKENVIIEK